MARRIEAARAHWRHAQLGLPLLLAARCDVGLLAEEYDPGQRRQVGNFPQAFSHIALINTAYNLHRASGPAVKRSSDKLAGSAGAP
jgi:GH15 family glucan-1,4-alpha-glucosidase